MSIKKFINYIFTLFKKRGGDSPSSVEGRVEKIKIEVTKHSLSRYSQRIESVKNAVAKREMISKVSNHLAFYPALQLETEFKITDNTKGAVYVVAGDGLGKFTIVTCYRIKEKKKRKKR